MQSFQEIDQAMAATLEQADVPSPLVRGWLWVILQTIIRSFFNVWLGYRAIGFQPLEKEGGALILANHQSFLDPLLIGIPLHRPISFLARETLFHSPVLGWILRNTHVMSINQEAASTASMRQTIRALQQGYLVGIFPEGTRVPPGQKGQYNASGAMLAHRVGCPVVPIAHNAGEFWARQAFLKWPGVIQIRIGPVIDGSQYSAAEINHKAEEWIEAQMQEITQVGKVG